MQDVFNAIQEILAPYKGQMSVTVDTDEQLYLDTQLSDEKGKPYFFAMVKLGKKDVSYHLMPLYCNSALLKGCSEELINAMSGKSCFKLKSKHLPLIKELNSLTKKAFEDYRSAGKI